MLLLSSVLFPDHLESEFDNPVKGTIATQANAQPDIISIH
jgi:hypothetical protein